MTWKRGQSGNLLGRPRGDHADLRALARAHTGEAVECLVTIMNDRTAVPSARTSAASAILDRGFGKPEVTVAASVIGESFADVLERINNEEGAEEIEAEKVLLAPSTE